MELLPGSLDANNAYNGAVEIVSFVVCAALSDRLGRRLMTGGLLSLGGLLCVLSSMTQYADSWLFIGKIFAIAAKSCVAGSFTMIYIFATELYPTEIRGIGMVYIQPRIFIVQEGGYNTDTRCGYNTKTRFGHNTKYSKNFVRE